jgi:hypothetical protein
VETETLDEKGDEAMEELLDVRSELRREGGWEYVILLGLTSESR